MSKRVFAALSAAALLATAGAGIASADNTDLFVEIQQPADQSVYPVGADVPVGGKVGAGADSTAKASVVFVVDASGSTSARVNDKSVFEWEQEGGKALLKSLRGDSEAVQIGVVYFGSTAVGYGLSNNMQDVDTWLSYKMYTPQVASGGTSCELGMAEANRLLADAKGHKRVYFLTDGKCNGSGKKLAAEVKKAKDAGIDVRSIHTTEASEQCQRDALQGNECIYAADPSKLVAQLPGETKPTVETLKVTVTNDKGEVVKEADLSDEVGVAIIEDWKLGVLKNLPAGKYTVTAKATAQGGASATDVVTFTIGEAGDTASPEPTETPSPTPAPEPEKPSLPNTGC
ncbi:VWA domain-containing protein [uncultured Tessaracoccus sp.]|uniref:VWA domain-containing protein n=1 Tax=uncultured Tessaracoccus sp. TaxID=905023 RepID=UPI002637C368|nr:VWA domain-containing protein [uncultured Tessaracoccus sp.]